MCIIECVGEGDNQFTWVSQSPSLSLSLPEPRFSLKSLIIQILILTRCTHWLYLYLVAIYLGISFFGTWPLLIAAVSLSFCSLSLTAVSPVLPLYCSLSLSLRPVYLCPGLRLPGQATWLSLSGTCNAYQYAASHH